MTLIEAIGVLASFGTRVEGSATFEEGSAVHEAMKVLFQYYRGNNHDVGYLIDVRSLSRDAIREDEAQLIHMREIADQEVIHDEENYRRGYREGTRIVARLLLKS